ncbi:(2Fe-2S) ferredoxin domain-containing protein [Streptomyces sp. 549]|uniref:(2Fe-2S) ferredoxin domain-containing protein n=1 Tax=Streptomyces sp. 549 TaxID=3049076 RepID=UPI0024C2306B|nr:(2Fe-2S) ferredoxin domain-containing protein [Streptomyces sp. 549]MDK1472074.1 (2Fe-2S) ferredoxin domain-containing protein [Streptomyces sp. 549]
MTASIIQPAGSPCTIVVCRGCCCGDARKHPRTDHVWQLDRLRAAAASSGGRVAVRTTDCLGPCGQANIVVVRPSAAGRRHGGRAAWIGWVMGDDCTEEIIDWADAGGPGLAEPPATLALQFVDPPRDSPAAPRARAARKGRGKRR